MTDFNALPLAEQLKALQAGDELHLHGMAACWQYGHDSPYQQLIDAIEQLGVIEVWPEY